MWRTSLANGPCHTLTTRRHRKSAWWPFFPLHIVDNFSRVDRWVFPESSLIFTFTFTYNLSIILALVAPARPPFVVLIRHLHEAVSERLAVFQADGPDHGRPEQLQPARHGRVGRQAARDGEGVRVQVRVRVRPEDVAGEAVQEGELERSVVPKRPGSVRDSGVPGAR